MADKHTKKSAGLVRFIGAFKLFKGLTLVALACGALNFLHKDIGDVLTQWLQQLHVDPGNAYFDRLLQKISGVDARKILLLATGTFFYAGLFLTEGVGLVMNKHWAEWFTVIVTGSFIPLEIFELIKHFTPLKVGVIVLNITIVIYLIVRLKRAANHRTI